MSKVEHDFLKWTSFPSSLKITNDSGERKWVFQRLVDQVFVTPGGLITVEYKVKQENVSPIINATSLIYIGGMPGDILLYGIGAPAGTYDWTPIKQTPTKRVPEGITHIFVAAAGGAGTKELPGVTWFDDLVIEENGKVIYENKFSNWAPFIAIPAPIVAGLGVVRFGKKG